MKLLTQKVAPDFKVDDYRGSKVHLSDYKNKKVLLSFFRTASCPFCNMRVQELIHKEQQFKDSGIEVIAFFSSNADEIKSYAGQQNPWFPMVADPEKKIYTLYDVEASKSGMLKTMLKPLKMMKMMTSGFFNLKSMKAAPIIPADFLLSPGLKIEKTYYGKDFGDHIDLKDILN
ncbi:peroxiredoxin-like family protein [Arenibacter sp. GZD96]|uniref:peroxiredoxin-like family protein n=1 Tax=Aurantibrevibacter litoralis TaxID=3106030 RepID=UPI002AFF4224|nr:peroxiredoxin-like family protein [Arenibacter sp. GZD-96]MEA1785450.1 peroxiredoxin-like family protein [Arenibacter sp. GZD-96]